MSKFALSDNQVSGTDTSNPALLNEPFAVATTTEDFGNLIYPYLEQIFAYVSRRVGSITLAEDITAETFRDALIHQRKFRSDDPYLWMLGIARRKVANAFRDRNRRREIQLGDRHIQIADAPGLNPDQIAIEKEGIAKLQELVLRLREDQREALLLQHLEQLSQIEIAGVMKKSVGAVNSLQQRARQNLQRWGYGYFTNEPQGESL
jgi:RNA polymerase sigma-70 factor (ECF subfamily)